MLNSGHDLLEEADFIHRRLFRAAAPPEVCRQYAAAHEHVLRHESAARAVDLGKILQGNLNVEAVEFYLRMRYGENRLTQKLQILNYLVEIRPQYWSLFANQREGFVLALLSLCWAACRSMALFAQGGFLCWRHEIL